MENHQEYFHQSSLLYQIETGLLLDKNPDCKIKIKIMKIIEKNEFTLIMSDEPFVKTSFIQKIIDFSNESIIYLDFDLLYSGFITAKILSLNENVHLYRLTHDNLQTTLKSFLTKISNKKCIVIIDSLNGFFNLLDKKDVGRLINSYIMLFAYVARSTHSQILVTGMTRLKDKDGWVLSPSGRHVLESDPMTKIHLRQTESGILTNILNEKNSSIESIRI